MKVTKTKKILSVLLSVIMLLSIVPMNMLTVSAETFGVFTYKVENNEAIIKVCSTTAVGEVVVPDVIDTYPVTEIGQLAFINCSKVSSISIPDSVKTIGNKAFSGCIALEEITLGKSVETLGNDIFLDCASLDKIIVASDNTVFSSDADGVLYDKDKTQILFYPIANSAADYTVASTVTEIADSTFAGSKNVKTITIGDNVEKIGANAFMGSRSLEKVTIGKGVIEIGNQAFSWCEKLSDITVVTDNTVYENDSDGILYNKGKTEIIRYPEADAKTEFIVPAGVKQIRTQSFLNAVNLKSVTFPKSLETIQASAFSGCTAIADVSYEGTEEEWKMVTIGSDNNAIIDARISFAGGEVHDHKYTETVTKAPTCIDSGVKTFKCDCSHTYTEVIDATGHAFKDNVCSGCSTKEFVLLTDGTNAKITGYNGVGGAIVIPETIEGCKINAIGDNAFENKAAVTSVTLPASVKDVGTNAFYNTGYYKTASNWENGVLYIGTFLIEANDTVKGEYTVKDGTTVIADFAFASRKDLKTITLPKEIEVIGDSAFSGCTGLTDVIADCTEEEWKSVIVNVGNDNFTKANFTFKVIPHEHVFTEKEKVDATCTVAGYKVSVCECGETKTETLPATGHKFVNNVCTGCNEREFNISISGEEVTVLGCHTSLSGEVTIPETISGYKVTAIAEKAFANNQKIEKIVIPAGVKSIGELAFTGSKIVVEVATENADYTSENGILYNKAKTNLIYCPVSKATKEFAVPSGITEIGESAFSGAAVIEKITLPKTLDAIGKDAFSGCTGIKEVVFEGTRTKWSGVTIGEGNESFIKAVFTYLDTSDVDDATVIANNIVVTGGKAENKNIVIVITADAEAKTIEVSRLAVDGKEVIIRTTDTLIQTDAEKFVLTFEDWHKSGNKTETEITVDGKTFNVQFVFPVEGDGHKFPEEYEDVDATCTAYGGKKYTCEICGATKVEPDSAKPAKGHAFGLWVVEKDETCTEDGVMKRTCSVCGEVERGNVPATKEHRYTSVVTEPKCTEKGFTTYTCSTCGDTYKGDETPAKGHDPEVTVVKAPTCEEAGESVCKCKVCDFEKEETVSAIGHRYEGTVVAPTYKDKGYTEYKCANEGCAATYKDNWVDSLSRVTGVTVENIVLYKDDVVTLNPNVKADGKPEWTATYKIADESIVSIDEKGVLTAKTRGVTTVECIITDEKGETFKDTFTVEVKFTVLQWITWFFVDLIYGGLRDFFSTLI